MSFGKGETELKNQIKKCLQSLPKKSVKYRQSTNISSSFDCYFKTVDSMRPLLNQVLKETDMYFAYVSIPDKQIFVQDLLQLGKEALQEQVGQGRGR